ncbi:uncharacterized protein LOC128805495 isoform X1 [Vidua macroura]|uniref:uncharacterized protein LOC128805495 isoform X1 n=1 Tax=Vidua macroura TaxID=187451 RepID=UPI0023A90FDB|nr:uncharacterized protein LOC128805495 isoform X1 [Vidua macroura]
MAGKPGRSEGRRELGAIASLRARGWGWPLNQLPPLPPPCPRPPRRSPLPSRRPSRRRPALPAPPGPRCSGPSRCGGDGVGRAATPAGSQPSSCELPGQKGADCSFPLPSPFLFLSTPWLSRGKWDRGRRSRGCKKLQLPAALPASWIPGSISPLSFLQCRRAGRGSAALSPATVRVCLQAAAAPPGCCCFQTHFLAPSLCVRRGHPFPHTAAPCIPTGISARLGWISPGETRLFQLVSASLAGLQSGFDSPYSSSWLLTCLSTVEKPFSLRWEDLKFKSNVDLKICENEGWIITCYKLISQHLV